MILDSSALIAVIMAEPGAGELLAKIGTAASAGIGAPTLVETAMVLSRRLNGHAMPLLAELLEVLDVEVIPFTQMHSRVAMDAFMRFGKGRHPAALNLGDCLTYAVASIAGRPLLSVGSDYAQTDLASA
ncbi:MAG: type II toxin-antitoxin system VapC family toxin [Acidobacteriia bacterium]|nr:type II toxin-antitoxin system VapC family toxin [Terriglobia bacterium]